MSDEASLVALRRAEKVALLEARKAERAVARDTRRSEMEMLRTTDGGTENVARSSDEFWSLFAAGERGGWRFDSCGIITYVTKQLLPPPASSISFRFATRYGRNRGASTDRAV